MRKTETETIAQQEADVEEIVYLNQWDDDYPSDGEIGPQGSTYDGRPLTEQQQAASRRRMRDAVEEIRKDPAQRRGVFGRRAE